uniref:Uncharacterized protein n=1 Tax=Eutreptiella gymnastica TaxID=73025 RepID=A0A7S1NAJ8_9EUGL
MWQHLAAHHAAPGRCRRPLSRDWVCGYPQANGTQTDGLNLAVSAGPHDFNIAIGDMGRSKVQVYIEAANFKGHKSAGIRFNATQYPDLWHLLEKTMTPYLARPAGTWATLGL